jgi:hypothetical protein
MRMSTRAANDEHGPACHASRFGVYPGRPWQPVGDPDSERFGPVQEGNAIAPPFCRFLMLSSFVQLWHLKCELAFEAADAF